MCAVGGFVHSVSLLQQLEELLHRDPRVRRPSQREDLPHQDPVGPPGHTDGSRCEEETADTQTKLLRGNVHGCVRLRIDGTPGESVNSRKDDSGGEEQRSHLTCAPRGVERSHTGEPSFNNFRARKNVFTWFY